MSRNSPLPPEVLDTIAACGFDVYQSPDPHWQTYLYYTDGTRIGYLQRGDWGGLSLSTVHIPNRTSGSGYRITEDNDPPVALTREALEKAFVVSPRWAFTADRASVRKWPDMETFLKGQIGRLERVREALAPAE